MRGCRSLSGDGRCREQWGPLSAPSSRVFRAPTERGLSQSLEEGRPHPPPAPAALGRCVRAGCQL